MINILLHCVNASGLISDWELDTGFVFPHEFTRVPEMKEDCYNVIIPINRVDALDAVVSGLGGNITWIGCWNTDGSKVLFDAPKDYRNFSISEYANQLILDVDTAAARTIQVNNIQGFGYRDLS